MNSIHKVERINGINKEEPNIIIVRTSGSELSGDVTNEKIRSDMMKLTEAEELLIVQEMSRLGRSPKLLGVFENGRVEEFRKMHNITPKEVIMPKYMEDSARAFAQFHSIKLPLNKARWDPFWEKAYHLFKNNDFNDWARRVAEELGLDASPFLSLKYDEEILWLNKIREKHFNDRSRMALLQDDTHYMNLVVNEKPRSGELNVYLLDYELCTYGPRGLDLGAHFFNRTMDFENYETFSSGEEMHTEEQRIQFLKYYQDELRKLDIKDFDDQGLDSIDNLLFESYVGALLYHVYFQHIAVNTATEEEREKFKTFLAFNIHFSKVYHKCKELTIEKYPFLDPKMLM